MTIIMSITGTDSRYRLTPQAFSAIISLFLARIPNVTSEATSTLTGAVS